jgi:hypothetical protein
MNVEFRVMKHTQSHRHTDTQTHRHTDTQTMHTHSTAHQDEVFFYLSARVSFSVRPPTHEKDTKNPKK